MGSQDLELARSFNEDVVERYGRRFVEFLVESIEIPSHPLRALDLACGTGYGTLPILAALPEGSTVVALSDDRFRLKEFHKVLSAQLRRKIFPRKENLQRLPFAKATFDLVWACYPTRLPENIKPILLQALRVLRPGGQLLLCVPLRSSFIELMQALGSTSSTDSSHTIQRMVADTAHLNDADEWSKLLIQCGGTTVRVERTRVEIKVEPPASKDRLITQHLRTMWLGGSGTTEIEPLLDAAIEEPLSVTVHVGCVSAQRGALDESNP